jgi:hypothetical protein
MQERAPNQFTDGGQNDLTRLDDFLPELNVGLAEQTLEVIKDARLVVEKFHFACRRAANGLHGPRIRELVISFGAPGYVALFEIEDASTVTILAVWRQQNEDYR